jgi:hypothetical protein
MRTLYLELKAKAPELAERIYFEDLRAQTLGTLVDPDNSKKSNFNIFKNVFDGISEEVSLRGFDAEQTLIPVSGSGSIINGAHRLSAALIHGKEVAFIQTTLPPITCDHVYFFERAVPIAIIEQSVVQLLRYARNCFVAFLWPSGSANMHLAESLFQNVVYKKKLYLTNKGKLNLLFQCYRHMDWVGGESSNYAGLHQKLIECFPENGDVTMIIFQAEGGVEHARSIKEKIRDINGLGYSSVHITDTQEELLRLSRLLCNENGMHYLNHAKLVNSRHYEMLRSILDLSRKNDIDPRNFLIDGSWLLELYDLRSADDVDILTASDHDYIYQLLNFDSRLSQVQYHKKTANEIIYNPNNYFYLFDIKLIGFEQLQTMKRNRGEAKDLLDVKLMSGLVEYNWLSMVQVHLAQRWLYARIRARGAVFKFGGFILRAIGLYKPVRAVYRFIFNRKHV